MTIQEATQEAEDPIRVGSFFLETLTTGMYENAFHCIREYVQNSYDAIREAVRTELIKEGEGRVLIAVGATGRNQSLSVRDNGTGIPSQQAFTALVSLGASHKSPMNHAGFRGIGRLAGIAYCSTLRFKTKSKGEQHGTSVEFDCGHIRGYLTPGSEPVDVRKVISASVKSTTFSDTEDAHYTEVEMLGLIGLGLEFIQMEKLRPYLQQVCPVTYADNFDYADRIRALAASFGDTLGVIEVETRVRRERISIHKPYKNSAAAGKDDTSTLFDIEPITSQEHGWYGWLGLSNFAGEIADDTVAAPRFRVQNIQIGDSRVIMDVAERLTRSGSERRLMRWAVGEIFVTNRQVIPNARRDGFEDTQAWRDIKDDIQEQVAKRLVKLVRGASSSRSAMKRISSAFETLQEEVDRPEMSSDEKKRLQSEIKKQLDKLGSDKLAGADPKEVSAAISRFKELQEKLAKIPTKGSIPPVPPEDNSGDESPKDETTKDEKQEPGDEDSTGVEPSPPGVLDVVLEVLAEELGDEEAQRLLDIIVSRLND
jgi:molecular chaperone HtpG